MSDIKGTVRVTGPMSPYSDQDAFPITLEEFQEGGYRSVANEEERLSIPKERRKEGMLVSQLDTGQLYTLRGGLSNDNWTPFTLDGETKDVVFQLGEDLEVGPQPYTEIRVPYKGYITEMIANVGEGSDRDTNLIFHLQRMNEDSTPGNRSWDVVQTFNIRSNEFDTHIKLDAEDVIPLDNQKLRIVLDSGNYSQLTTMNVITKVTLE